nr:YitT family protein [Mycoplasma haemocanis]
MFKDNNNSNIFRDSLLNLNPKKRVTTPLSIGATRLQFLFDIERFSCKLGIVILVAIFSGICNFFLLERTGLYSLGINSFFQATARCVSYFLKKNNIPHEAVYTFLFWGTILLFNIFLAVFGYRNIGPNFTLLSIAFISVSTITSIILSSLPTSLGLKDFYIFSDPRTFNTCLTEKKINILQWQYFFTSRQPSNNNYLLNDSSKVVLIFFYGLVFGLLNTLTSLIIYSLGGSSGGIDWIIFYFSKKRMNSTNNAFLYFGIIVTFISYIIGTYVPYADHLKTHQSCSDISLNPSTSKLLAANFVGPVFVSTMIAAFTKKILFGIFYPHLKLINVRIFTNKFLQFREVLLSSNFPHSFTIHTATGGYFLRKQMIFEVTCFALELKTLKEFAKRIDSNSLVISSPVTSLNGKLPVKSNLK